MDLNSKVTQSVKATLGEQAFQMILMAAQLEAAQDMIAQMKSRDHPSEEVAETDK